MESETTYTVFIRLPFPRGDFVDPPPVSDGTNVHNTKTAHALLTDYSR